MFDTTEFTFSQACELTPEALEFLFVLIERDFISFVD